MSCRIRPAASEVLAGRGSVKEDNGTDVTAMFVEGAHLAADRAVVLQDRGIRVFPEDHLDEADSYLRSLDER